MSILCGLGIDGIAQLLILIEALKGFEMVWDLTGLITALTAAFAAFSFFVSIYAWLKRREVFIWHKKTARLEKKLIDTPPELVIEQNKTKF